MWDLFFSMTMTSLLFIESVRPHKVLASIFFQQFLKPFIKSNFEWNYPQFLWTFRAKIPQIFSITCRSGLRAGHWRHFTWLASSQDLVDFETWTESLSCWNVQFPEVIRGAMGNKLSPNISWCIIEFIYSCMKTTEVVPPTAMAAQTIAEPPPNWRFEKIWDSCRKSCQKYL